MNAQTDQQLLRDYTGSRSEAAFAELVRRHIDLVYSAALRMVCDSHQAEDVTQGVFVALAKNARQLTKHPVLSGWLHRTTQNLAANAVRTNVRRQTREQEAVAMNELLSAETDTTWENIAPHLDAALGELNEPDRDALLLRYFERKSAREIAQTLGISDVAAQKRVSRAVERLREFFAKRGVTVGVSGLVVVISANAVQAAPVGLAISISTSAAATGATMTTATAVKIITMTTLQKTMIAATIGIALAAGTGIFVIHQHKANQEITAKPDKPSDYFPQASWSFAGFADPESAFESMHWAVLNGDVKTLIASMSPDGQARFRNQMQNKTESEIAALLSNDNDFKKVSAYRITGKEVVSDDHVIFTIFQEGSERTMKATLKRYGNEWKNAK